jgi:hypothetical protein
MHTGAKSRAIPYGGADLQMGVSHHYTKVMDACCYQSFDSVEEHRLIGKRQQLLGASIGKRTEARALAATQD